MPVSLNSLYTFGELSSEHMQPSTSRRQQESTVSHDDGAKVTMQTRVAVRDKTPHRFQVIPLREIMRRPSQAQASSQSASPRSSSKLSQRGPSGRRTNTKDSAGNPDAPKTRTHTGISERPVLQDRDINTDSSSQTHKKTTSLEIGRTSEESPMPVERSPTIGSSRYFSQSLNQYSFRLKPWKSHTNLQSTPTRTRTANRHSEKGPLDDLTKISNFWNRTRTDSTPSSVDLGTSGDAQPGQDPHFSDQYSPGLSITLNDPVAQLNMVDKLSDQRFKKRNAIYSHIDILPAGSPGLSSSLEGDSSSGIYDVFSDLRDARNIRRTTFPVNSPDTSLDYTPDRHTVHSFPHTPPLKLARKPAFRCSSGPTFGTMCYPDTVLELFRELDDAIESWNNTSQ